MRKLLQDFFCCAFILAAFNSQIFSQATERKKPKIKNFGASLKRTPQENLRYSKKKQDKENNDDKETIKIETNLVIFDFLVLDRKGFPVAGLKKEDLIVAEDDRPQEIQTLTTGDDRNLPRSIVLIIDYSGSQLPYLERSIESAKLLIDKLRPNDLMAIVTDDVELFEGYTSDKRKLKDALDELKPNKKSFSTTVPFDLPKYSKRRMGIYGKSQQYSALYAVLNEMFDQGDVRPIVVFQTDGDQLMYLKGQCKNEVFCPPSDNTMTNFFFRDLLAMTDKSRATIYTVVPGFRHSGLTPEEKKLKLEEEKRLKRQARGLASKNLSSPSQEDLKKQEIRQALEKQYYPDGLPDPQDALTELSRYSGGWIDFLEKSEQAEEIYSKILSQIELRYVVSYSPANETKDGKLRNVKVSVKDHPEYVVWGRKTYLAPFPD